MAAALLPHRSHVRHAARPISGSTIRYDNPREVGADRLVNGVAGFHKYGGPCVVVDLGTAINFDVVSANAEYLGGMIAPGIGISSTRCSPRPRACRMVDFREPERRDRHQHGGQHADRASTTAPSA